MYIVYQSLKIIFFSSAKTVNCFEKLKKAIVAFSGSWPIVVSYIHIKIHTYVH